MDYTYHLDYIKYPRIEDMTWKDIAPAIFIMGCLTSIVVFKELFKMVFHNEYDNLEGDIEHMRISHQNQLNELSVRVSELETARQEQTGTVEESVSDSEFVATEQSQPLVDETLCDESQPPQEQESLPTISPVAKNANHAKVLRHLLNRDVYVSYKGKVVVGKIKAKSASPHGYIVQCESDEYNTLSNFSFSKKSAINPNLTSDSGWDSVYVVTGATEKGKQIKKSIRAFVADLA